MFIKASALGIIITLSSQSFIPCCDKAGADPEISHGRWLMRWLPIVNHTGAKGVAD